MYLITGIKHILVCKCGHYLSDIHFFLDANLLSAALVFYFSLFFVLHLTFFHLNNAMEMAQPHTVHKDYSDYKQAGRDIHPW